MDAWFQENISTQVSYDFSQHAVAVASGFRNSGLTVSRAGKVMAVSMASSSLLPPHSSLTSLWGQWDIRANYVNILPADALAPGVARSSADRILMMYTGHLVVILEREFQQHAPL